MELSLFSQEVVQVAALPPAAARHHQHPAPRVAQPPARLVGLLRRLVHHHALPLLFPGTERSCLVMVDVFQALKSRPTFVYIAGTTGN